MEAQKIQTNELLEKIYEVLINPTNITFAEGCVPVEIAARVYGKDADWVRAGIIVGWLPIGYATRKGKRVTNLEEMNSKHGRINYVILPKKLYDDTGYIWDGKKA